MKIEYRVDTFNTTHDYNHDVLSYMLPTLRNLSQTMENATPQRGYASCWRVNPHGLRINWHDEIRTQGIHYQYGGQCLEWYDQNTSQSSTDIVAWHFKRGGRTSRIDIAIDVYGSGMTREHVANHLPSATTRARKAELVSNQLGAGWTQYVGARSGERFLRIYDKGAESGSGLDHVRIELEIKGKRAKQFSALMVTAIEGDSVYALFCAEICAYCDFDTMELWNDIMSQKSASRATTHEKKRTDTVRWLLEQVAPVLAREFARDDSLRARFNEQVEQEYHDITNRDILEK